MTKDQERWVVGIMLMVTLVKLVLMVYCRSFTNEIVKAYAQDHFFDVITNIIGLFAALLANYFDDWMDPVGAIIVSDISLSLSLSLFLSLALPPYLPPNKKRSTLYMLTILSCTFIYANIPVVSFCIARILYFLEPPFV